MSGNFIHIAPPEAYNQVYNYYQRVIGDGGTLIDAEAVNRIYHNLNLVNFENRNYKLYHASAGLQKTSDKIDKLYDLGKDDIDQTFSGSDRPEHVQAWSNSEGVGNWQMSVEKDATNYCKESNDLGSIFGGNWTKTENKGDSPFGDSNEAVEVEMNTNSTGASNYIELDVDTATNFSSGDYITVSFYAKKIAGSSGQPELLIEGEDGNSNPISLIQQVFSTQIGEYQFFEFSAQFSADGTLRQSGCRIQDNNSSADTVYQAWGFQIEHGRYATSRIHTDGSTTTRLAPDSELENFYPEKGTIVMWFNQVYQPGDGGNNSMVYSKNSDYYIRLRDNLPNGVYYQWQIEPGKFLGLNNDLKSLFNMQDYQEFKVCIALTWSKNNQKKLIIGKKGDADFVEANHSLTFTGSKNFKLGQWDAAGTRSNHKIHFDDIYISKETSSVDELKELVASLSKYEGGANLKTEDITIV